jgi:hypothetical protein
MSRVTKQNPVPNEKELKREAKELSRQTGISYCKALDQIAKNYKFIDYHHFQKSHSDFFDGNSTVFWFTISDKFSEKYFQDPYKFEALGFSEDRVFYQFILKDIFSLISSLPPEEQGDLLKSSLHDGKLSPEEKAIDELENGWTKCFRCMLPGKLSTKKMKEYVARHFFSPEELFHKNKVHSFGFSKNDDGTLKEIEAKTFKSWVKETAEIYLSENSSEDL